MAWNHVTNMEQKHRFGSLAATGRFTFTVVKCILFTLEKDLIFVHLVKDRKDAYRD